MWEEVARSAKEAWFDRAKSPLSGAFILSWCVINYKILVLLFLGDDKAIDRITNIQNLTYSSSLDWISCMVALPLLSALLWIYIYPVPAKFAYTFWKTKSEELNAIKIGIEKKRLLTRDESDAIIISGEKATQQYMQSLGEKDRTIEALTRKIADLQSDPGKQKEIVPVFQSVAERYSVNDARREVDGEAENSEIPQDSSQNGDDFWGEYVNLDKNVLSDFIPVLEDIYGYGGGGLTVAQRMKYHPMGIILKKKSGIGYFLSEKGKRYAQWYQEKK